MTVTDTSESQTSYCTAVADTDNDKIHEDVSTDCTVSARRRTSLALGAPNTSYCVRTFPSEYTPRFHVDYVYILYIVLHCFDSLIFPDTESWGHSTQLRMVELLIFCSSPILVRWLQMAAPWQCLVTFVGDRVKYCTLHFA